MVNMIAVRVLQHNLFSSTDIFMVNVALVCPTCNLISGCLSVKRGFLLVFTRTLLLCVYVEQRAISNSSISSTVSLWNSLSVCMFKSILQSRLL